MAVTAPTPHTAQETPSSQQLHSTDSTPRLYWCCAPDQLPRPLFLTEPYRACPIVKTQTAYSTFCDLFSDCAMPSTDGLQPPLTPAERTIVKSYGGWTSYMHSFGLKPWDMDDIDEGKRIVEAFVQDDNDAKGKDAEVVEDKGNKK
ncbi:hypothetical protein N7462_010802 [Penicillium macrosclerotiorum]|uniref:uncharacterized protein n=1 Tax=Penicillium macrosclerotiorum TaxID=303699 RepID=UPI0025498168|nr:uncharacterized protein N7462_010802 [Penicillium macrosclerotiorum]KAJ5669732.1 hypothetical protein N7462_010802 [Penicillium macrosclerotiorum]